MTIFLMVMAKTIAYKIINMRHKGIKNYELLTDSNFPLKGCLGVEMECRFGDVLDAIHQTIAKHESTTMEMN